MSTTSISCCRYAFTNLHKKVSSFFRHVCVRKLCELTFDAKSVPFNLSLKVVFLALEFLNCRLHMLHRAPLLLKNLFKLSVAHIIHTALRLHMLDLALKLVDLLKHLQLFIFAVTDLSLQVGAVLLLTHGHLLECLKLVGKLVPLICQLLHVVALAFHLLGQVVNMPL